MILYISVERKRGNVLQSTEPDRQGSKECPREMYGSLREGGIEAMSWFDWGQVGIGT